MKTISIVNLKGGVGKTVTTVNMAAQLAAKGKKVIVIDADPQANATAFFLEDKLEDGDATVADVLSGACNYYPDVLYFTNFPNVELIPADISLIEADIASIRNGHCVKRLSGLVRAIDEDNKAADRDGINGTVADYVLIDCPPSFTAASVAAIAASDEIIIPLKIDAFALDGMRELMAQVNAVKGINRDLRVAGILITMWHNTASIIQGEQLLRQAGLPVFMTRIRRSDKVDESTFARQPLSCYSKTSSAGKDYTDFVNEYLLKEVH